MTRLAFLLLWLFVFSIPMTYATEIPMIGTISSAVGIAAMVIAAVSAAMRRRVRILGGAHLAMAAFIVWSAITLSWSVAPDLTIQRILTYIQLFVLALLVWEMCTEERDVLRILGAFVLGTILPSLSTLKGFLPGQQILLERAALGSPGGAAYDANQLAFVLALSLPASYYLILKEKGPLVSLCRLEMGFAFCAILLTGSPSAITAMAAGLSIVLWTLQSVAVRTRVNALCVMTLLAGAALLLVPASVWKGVRDEVHKGDVTLTRVVDTGVDRMYRTPFQGHGAGTRALPASAFGLYEETGPLGVACFLAMLAALFGAAVRMPGLDRSLWLTSLAVWIFGAFYLNYDCSQPAWLLFGLLAAHAGCHRSGAEVEVPAIQVPRLREEAEVWS